MRLREGLKNQGAGTVSWKMFDHQCGAGPRLGLEGCLVGRANVAVQHSTNSQVKRQRSKGAWRRGKVWANPELFLAQRAQKEAWPSSPVRSNGV